MVQLKHAACDFQLKHAPHDTLQLSCPRDNISSHAAQLPPFTSVLYTAVNMHPDSSIDGALQAQAADVHQFLRAAAPPPPTQHAASAPAILARAALHDSALALLAAATAAQILCGFEERGERQHGEYMRVCV